MSPPGRFPSSSIALAVGLAALAIAAWLFLKTNRLENEIRRNSVRQSPASTESAPRSDRETDVPRAERPGAPSQTQATAPPFAPERAAPVERENKSEAQIRQETTDRYNLLWQTFLAQPTSSFEPARANSMRDRFNAQLGSQSLAPDTHIGSLDCRGNMCSAEISYTKLDDAQNVNLAARAAADRMREDIGKPPLVHFMALPQNDDGSETGRVYFEWLPTP